MCKIISECLTFTSVLNSIQTPPAPIDHGQNTVYSCSSGYDPHPTDVTTRTCQDGALSPAIDASSPLNCYQSEL